MEKSGNAKPWWIASGIGGAMIAVYLILPGFLYFGGSLLAERGWFPHRVLFAIFMPCFKLMESSPAYYDYFNSQTGWCAQQFLGLSPGSYY